MTAKPISQEAAQAMLAALRQALVAVANISGEANSGRTIPPAILADGCKNIMADIRAAIAKAEG